MPILVPWGNVCYHLLGRCLSAGQRGSVPPHPNSRILGLGRGAAGGRILCPEQLLRQLFLKVGKQP